MLTSWPSSHYHHRFIHLHLPNFFKHADRDPDEVLDFRPEATTFLLLECMILYQLLTGRMLREGHVYVTWFSLAYPKLLKPGPLLDSVTRVRAATGSAPSKSMFLEMLNRSDLFPNTD